MRELHRVMKKGAALSIKVPEFPCAASVADPTHVRFFVPRSFEHFCGHGGLQTESTADLFRLEICESVPRPNTQLDRGLPGSFFTEMVVELVKPDPERDAWIKKREQELLAEAEKKGKENVSAV